MGRRELNYPPELRERAVRMIAQVRPEYPSDWPAICAVAEMLGIGTAETLRKWVRQAEVDAGAILAAAIVAVLARARAARRRAAATHA